MKKDCLVALFIFLTLCTQLKAEDSSETIKKLEARKSLIHNAAVKFDVSESCLKAIIFVERTMNYDWKDDVLDEILAASGLNSSLGFCQVKLKTAYWIENQINNAESEFYPGDKYKGLLKISRSPKELIKKLYSDSLNICYAAAYLRIFQYYWEKSGCPLDNSPEILGTLYSLGPYDNEGILRRPNSHPKPNLFGRNALDAINRLK